MQWNRSLPVLLKHCTFLPTVPFQRPMHGPRPKRLWMRFQSFAACEVRIIVCWTDVGRGKPPHEPIWLTEWKANKQKSNQPIKPATAQKYRVWQWTSALTWSTEVTCLVPMWSAGPIWAESWSGRRSASWRFLFATEFQIGYVADLRWIICTLASSLRIDTFSSYELISFSRAFSISSSLMVDCYNGWP